MLTRQQQQQRLGSFVLPFGTAASLILVEHNAGERPAGRSLAGGSFACKNSRNRIGDAKVRRDWQKADRDGSLSLPIRLLLCIIDAK